jgi:hypothetical protein
MQSLLFDVTASAATDRKSRTQEFYQKVRDEYWRMRNTQRNGARLYSDEYILNNLSVKFFRSTRTIEKIVNNWV